MPSGMLLLWHHSEVNIVQPHQERDAMRLKWTLAVLFCILTASGCLHLRRKKGSPYEEGISDKERQYRTELQSQQDFIRAFNQPKQEPPVSFEVYHDWW